MAILGVLSWVTLLHNGGQEKRKDKISTLVFKDVESKEILIWKHVESE